MAYIDEINEFNTTIKRVEKLLFLSRFFKNKKMFLTALEESHHTGKLLLVSILKYNHAKGNIKLTNKPEENLKILKEKVSKDWEIEEEVNSILDLMQLYKKHKSSPTEFMRKGFVIILDENQNLEKINLKRLKGYSNSIKCLKESFQAKINQ